TVALLSSRALFAITLSALIFAGLSLENPSTAGRVVCSLLNCHDSSVPLTGAYLSTDLTANLSQPLLQSDDLGLRLDSNQSLQLDFSNALEQIPKYNYVTNVTFIFHGGTYVTPTPVPTPTPLVETKANVEQNLTAFLNQSNLLPPVSNDSSGFPLLVPLASSNPREESLNGSANESGPNQNATGSNPANETLFGSNASASQARDPSLSGVSNASSQTENTSTSVSPSPSSSVNASTSVPTPTSASENSSASSPSSSNSSGNVSGETSVTTPTPPVSSSVSNASAITPTPQASPSVPNALATPSPQNGSSNTSSLTFFKKLFFDSAPSAVWVSAFNGTDYERACALTFSQFGAWNCDLNPFFDRYPLLLAFPKLRLDLGSDVQEPAFLDQVELIVSYKESDEAKVNVTKTKSDQRFDAIIDSMDREGEDLKLQFHHDSLLVQPIFVKGDLDYILSQNASGAGENVTLYIFNYSNQFFKLRIGNRSEVFDFGLSQSVDFVPRITDSADANQGAVVTVRDSDTQQSELIAASSSNAKIEQGEYNVDVALQGGPLSQVRLERVSIFSDTQTLLRVETVSNNQTGLNALESFAIAPGDVDFEAGLFTRTAKG
ncbi:MAG TPA: hypothetical protein VI874_02240, partial [Candidatus Norongarragalinales archaeon]|nr:hypothetical protein [Candidatus Norongarragalinales archaeon]